MKSREKYIIGVFAFLVIVCIICFFYMDSKTGIFKERNSLSGKNQESIKNRKKTKIQLEIGKYTFTAILEENQTAKQFLSVLPITIEMEELNQNEKYYRFLKSIEVNPTVPSQIEIGDLMFYSTDTFVLFYETFPTSYSYTKIGKIEDTSALQEALGTGSVSVTIKEQK